MSGNQHSAWTPDEYKDFTDRLRSATEKHWPELWERFEKQNTDVEERAWEISLRIRKYLRLFWEAPNDRERDWYIHRAREYHYRLHILPELSKLDEPIRALTADQWTDEPTKRNSVEMALYELQKSAIKSSTAPRVCPNDCEAPYFLSNTKGQRYCPDCRRSEGAKKRLRASKLTSYHKNKDKWPSTAERRKVHA